MQLIVYVALPLLLLLLACMLLLPRGLPLLPCCCCCCFCCLLLACCLLLVAGWLLLLLPLLLLAPMLRSLPLLPFCWYCCARSAAVAAAVDAAAAPAALLLTLLLCLAPTAPRQGEAADDLRRDERPKAWRLIPPPTGPQRPGVWKKARPGWRWLVAGGFQAPGPVPGRVRQKPALNPPAPSERAVGFRVGFALNPDPQGAALTS